MRRWAGQILANVLGWVFAALVVAGFLVVAALAGSVLVSWVSLLVAGGFVAVLGWGWLLVLGLPVSALLVVWLLTARHRPERDVRTTLNEYLDRA